MISLNDQYLTQRNKTPPGLNSNLLKTRNFPATSTSSRLSSAGSTFPMNFGLRFPSSSSNSSTATAVHTNQANFNYNNLPTFLNSSSSAFNKKSSRVTSSNSSSSNTENLPFVSRDKLVDKGLFPNVNTNAFPIASNFGGTNSLFRNYTPSSLFNTLVQPSQQQKQQQQVPSASQPSSKPTEDQLDPETEFMNFLKYLAIISYRLGKKVFVWFLFVLTCICSYIVKLIDEIPNPRITELNERVNESGLLPGLAESTPQLNSTSRFGQEQHPADQRISSILNKLVPTNLAMSLMPPPDSQSSTPGSGLSDTPSPAKGKHLKHKGSAGTLNGIGISLKQRLIGGGNVNNSSGATSRSKISELAAKLNASKLNENKDNEIGCDDSSVIVQRSNVLSHDADKIRKGDKQYGTFFFKSDATKSAVGLFKKPSNVVSFNPSSPNNYQPPNLELQQRNKAEEITNTIKNMLFIPPDDDTNNGSNMNFTRSSTRFKDLEWLKDDNIDYVENLESSKLFKEYQKIMKERLQMRELLKLSQEQPPVHELKKLTSDQLRKVENYWMSDYLHKQVIDEFSIPITIRDLKTLTDGKWLNDNVIDFYMKLIIQRSKDNSSKLPQIHAFSTHFYTNLSSKGYGSVKKWAKRAKVDVVQMDYIFVPVNIHGAHWALALIDNKHKRFQYYDSLFGGGADILRNLKTYMVEETKKQHGKLIVDYDSYGIDCTIKDSPRQYNGSDCGVFTCTCVDYLAREQSLMYGQEDMLDLRRRMAFEISTGKLLEH